MKLHGFAFNTLLPWLVPALLLAAWFALAKIGWISSRVFPTPWEVFQAALTLGGSGELGRVEEKPHRVGGAPGISVPAR